MNDRQPPAPRASEKSAVDAFVRQARALAEAKSGGGRLILALDATMSRQPTWDLACELQADMFDAAARSGKLDIQLVYFRGLGECRASSFVGGPAALKALMTRIDCRAGHTQIGKVLAHALKENAAAKVQALVYIGDAMEENIDDLAVRAGALGLRGVPVFLFQEGKDHLAETAFKEIARLTRGAWFRFDRQAAANLSRLLSAIAVFATGGLKALEKRGTAEDRLLIANMGQRSGPKTG
jgi:hypothetical protein